MPRMLPWLMLAILVACSGEHGQAGSQPERAITITTTTSGTRDVEVVEEALGRIEDPQSTIVAAEVPARVQSVRADVGDVVAKGALLATLDDRDLRLAVSQAQAALARNRAQLRAQSRLVDRYRKLAGQNFVSQTMLEQAEAQLTALRKAQAAAAARLEQARHNLSRTRIVAPMAGVVQRRWVAAGDYIGVGKPMFQLVQDDTLVVSITIPETRVSMVKPGMSVRLHAPGSRRVVEARVDELTPMIGAASNALLARCHVRNPGGWRPGGSVVAVLVLARHPASVVVPEESVVLRPEGEVVYRIEGDRARAQRVRTGVRRAGWVEIREGLKPGVRVARTGAAFLSDGARVRIQAAH